MFLSGDIVCCRRATSGLTIFLMISLALPAFSRAAEPDKGKSEGEKVYEIGGDVKPPKLVHVVEPSFDSHSESAFVAGVVKIQVIVKKSGVPEDPKILSGISRRQDEKAVEAVRQWRFRPATKDDIPVSVRVTVEVDFQLL
jgi:periplasmic protein TonB